MAESGLRELGARTYFGICRVLGRLLRSSRYSKVRIVDHDGELQVRKRRSFYAPLLIGIGNLLLRGLDTGVRVLPQREWEERERRIYQALYDRPVYIDAGETLVLPRLSGETLARVLEDAAMNDSVRTESITQAVVALVGFHRRGLTHGDAMAENVLVDRLVGIARWFDFETMHDSRRPLVWRRADDVRALLVTCLLRTERENHAATLRLILDVYGDDNVTRMLATSFTSVVRRALPFHLGQAGLSFHRFREMTRLLKAWLANHRDARSRLMS